MRASGRADPPPSLSSLLLFDLMQVILRGHEESVAVLSFSADGGLLASGDLRGQVRVWSLPLGSLYAVLDEGADAVESLAWHPRGRVLAVGDEVGALWLWSLTGSTPRLMHFLGGHAGPIVSCQWTLDGRRLVTAAAEEVRVWDPTSGQALLTLQRDSAQWHSSPLTVLAVSATLIASCAPPFSCPPHLSPSGSEDGRVCVSALETGRLVGSWQHAGGIEGLRFHPSLPLLLVASHDAALTVYDLPSLSVRHRLAHGSPVVGVVLDSAGERAVSITVDGRVCWWEVRSGVALAQLRGHTSPILALAALPGLPLSVLTASDDATARVWRFPPELR